MNPHPQLARLVLPKADDGLPGTQKVALDQKKTAPRPFHRETILEHEEKILQDLIS